MAFATVVLEEPVYRVTGEGLGVMEPLTLSVDVVEIEGHCPVYRVGDRFRIEEGYKLVSEQPVCLHALQSVCPYYVGLSRGIAPSDLGLAGPDGAAYVQCLDPHRYTGGGTVIFRICAEERSLAAPSGRVR